MSKGLPLANPAQQGLLFQGLIQQCWGNWIGTSMTLEFLVTQAMPAKGTAATATVAGQSKSAGGGQAIGPQTPLNLVLAWQPGQGLGDAAKSALAIALPGMPISVNASPMLTNNTGALVPGIFRNLSSFARWLNDRSINIVAANPYGGTGYPGVQVAVQNGGISLYDGQGPTASNVKAISFVDLVGQPIFRSAFQVQITCILRGDLSLGQVISLPQTLTTIASGQNFAPNQPRSALSFQGNFLVVGLRHVGNYKQASGDRWITVIDAVPATPQNSNVAQPPAGNVTIDSIDLSPVAPSTTTFTNGAETITGTGGAP
jgi:hypothetical protein